MQPVLSVATETPGVIYVNGRMVGEADGDHAPMLPVSPYGAVIVEHRPFGGDHLPLCARLVFSAGEPVAASLAGQAGVSAICWPGGATELMLAPFCLRGAEQAFRTLKEFPSKRIVVTPGMVELGYLQLRLGRYQIEEHHCSLRCHQLHGLGILLACPTILYGLGLAAPFK